MKTTNQIITEIEANENTGLRVANMGLSIRSGNDVKFYNSIEDLKEAVQSIDVTNLYSIDVKFSKWMFLQITVSVSYLTEAEINKPFNVVKIARNINAFDVNYNYIDNGTEYKFWSELYNTIQNKINALKSDEIEALKKLTNSNITIFKIVDMKTEVQNVEVAATETKKQNVKSKVFSTAWEMVKATNKKFAVCLSMAWNLYRLRKRMFSEVVKFAFEKTDGTLRKAKGTLQNVSSLIKGTGKENLSTFSYFDVDANAFRSFRVENLVAIF